MALPTAALHAHNPKHAPIQPPDDASAAYAIDVEPTKRPLHVKNR